MGCGAPPRTAPSYRYGTVCATFCVVRSHVSRRRGNGRFGLSLFVGATDAPREVQATALPGCWRKSQHQPRRATSATAQSYHPRNNDCSRKRSAPDRLPVGWPAPSIQQARLGPSALAASYCVQRWRGATPENGTVHFGHWFTALVRCCGRDVVVEVERRRSSSGNGPGSHDEDRQGRARRPSQPALR
jgi:hypothetical protein